MDEGFKDTMKDGKPYILCLVDNSDWCWAHDVNNIIRALGDRYAFRVLQAQQVQKAFHERTDFDLVWNRGYSWTPEGMVRAMGLQGRYIWTMTTGGAALDGRIKSSRGTAEGALGMVAQNSEARERLSKEFPDIPFAWLMQGSVDTNHFRPPQDIEEMVRKRANRPFTVGFAGNAIGSRAELKGLPLVREAVKTFGDRVRLVTCLKDTRTALPHEEMPSFFANIDLYAQPSDSEGCSNSVIEALACGVPCVIGKVGYHAELYNINAQYHELFPIHSVERTVEAVAQSISFWINRPAHERQYAAGFARGMAMQMFDVPVVAREVDEMLTQALDWIYTQRIHALTFGEHGDCVWVVALQPVQYRKPYAPGERFLIRKHHLRWMGKAVEPVMMPVADADDRLDALGRWLQKNNPERIKAQ